MVYYIRNGAFFTNLRRAANAKKDESNHHALLRYFKLKGIEFAQPPRVFLDENAGMVKFFISKEQKDEIKAAMEPLFSQK